MTNTYTASCLDGRQVALGIKHNIQETIAHRVNQGLRPPGLAVILVGEDPASSLYVKIKRQTCLDLGFQSFAYNLPLHTTEIELLSLLERLNNQSTVDGILVQLPLPAHINTTTILEHINPMKDVDGFHPYNLGRLAQGNPTLRPCTPYGIITLLKHYQIKLHGKHAVVIGASNIVGRPMAFELLIEKATVTLCHRASQPLEPHVRMADIIIVGTGTPDLIKPAWLNRQQILIDVGMHRLPNGTVRGEVDFMEAQHHVAWITPVPGGVGPMTICTLLQNTLFAAKIHTKAHTP